MEAFSTKKKEKVRQTQRAKQRHMKCWERYVRTKEAAGRQMGTDCKGEPAGKGRLEDDVSWQRGNLIWPERLIRLLHKWQMASLGGHAINKTEPKSQGQKSYQ